MLNTNDILETIQMITDEHLDVRTVTMGISLLDCADPDGRKACEKIYRKITEKAKDLVKTAEDISATYGMPIVNKRISVTPIAMLLASAPDADPVWYAKTLDAAAKAVGVNFIGGFGALVGARVLYMLARYSYIMVDLGGSSFFWQFWQGGYTLYGGILGGMGAIALYAKLTKQKALPLLDAVTPGALLALCGLRLAEGFTGQGFSKQMDDICWYFLPFQNEDGQMLVWAYEAIVAAVALVIVLVQGRRQKIAGRTLETGLTIISVMQVLLDSWRADELIRFGFVRLNMLMAALTLAVLLASRLTRCIRRDGLKRISITRIVMLMLGAGVCIAVEFALDKSAINNGILYGVMMLALVPMFIAVLLDDGRIQTAEERK